MKFRWYFLWLSGIMVVVFGLQQISGFTEMFVLNGLAIDNFEVWRYVSAIFLHGGIAHLLYNLFALLFFGFSLERTIGSRNFLLVFFSSGIFANIVGVNFYASSLGASGAIYGVLGAMTVLRPMMMVWAFGAIVPMFVAAILWVGADLLRIFGFFEPGNIGSIAHLSGIVVGIVIGLYYRSRIRKVARNKLVIPDNYMRVWEDRYMKN